MQRGWGVLWGDTNCPQILLPLRSFPGLGSECVLASAWGIDLVVSLPGGKTRPAVGPLSSRSFSGAKPQQCEGSGPFLWGILVLAAVLGAMGAANGAETQQEE